VKWVLLTHRCRWLHPHAPARQEGSSWGTASSTRAELVPSTPTHRRGNAKVEVWVFFFPIASTKRWASQSIDGLPALPPQLFFYRNRACPREVPSPNPHHPPSRETSAKTWLEQQPGDPETPALSSSGAGAGWVKPGGALVTELSGGFSIPAFPHWENPNSISQLRGRTGSCLGGVGAGSLAPCQPAGCAGSFAARGPSFGRGRLPVPIRASASGEPKPEVCAGCHRRVGCVSPPQTRFCAHQGIKH